MPSLNSRYGGKTKRMSLCSRLSALGVLAVSAAAGAQTSALHDLDLGLSGGVYLPAQKKMQDIFGNAIYKFGLDLGSKPTVRNYRWVPSVGVVSADRDGNKLFVGQLLASYEFQLGKPSASQPVIQPFGRVSAGLAYADYSITDSTATHYGAKHILPTGQAMAGLIIGERFRLTASYNIFSSIDTFSFNGFAISLTYSLFKL